MHIVEVAPIDCWWGLWLLVNEVADNLFARTFACPSIWCIRTVPEQTHLPPTPIWEYSQNQYGMWWVPIPASVQILRFGILLIKIRPPFWPNAVHTIIIADFTHNILYPLIGITHILVYRLLIGIRMIADQLPIIKCCGQFECNSSRTLRTGSQSQWTYRTSSVWVMKFPLFLYINFFHR